jgi:putative membrane-bound dehydrogenase-like protein
MKLPHRPACPRLALPALLLAAGGLRALLTAGPPSAASDPPPPPDRLATITVPPGFVVERVAGTPLVEHPYMATFDERGRLYVCDAEGVNLDAAHLLKDPPNRIRLLEDTDGDGRFDRSTVFADKMTFPMGVLPYDGAVYSASAPSLWRLRDRDGTGVADHREELVTKFGFSGNAADIHGPFLGPDGRLYWTDGRHGHEIVRPDGSVLKGKAARVFRCRPDGRDVEVVCGGGMDDPVEVAFTEEGEPLATVDILVGQPRRIDAIIHCVEGGVFPYNEVFKEFKSTGDLLPATSQLGWVAPAGLMRLRGTALGRQYQDNLFTAQFNLHRVQRHVLERDGASFRATNEDFLVSTDTDFHPTDVLEDADGSLLVVDTGGWFRIGCPASRIAKPEVKGAIYRVRRRDAPRPDDPRGLALRWGGLPPHELTRLLRDERFAVRDRAVEALGRRGPAALDDLKQVLQESGSVMARRNAVWALTRIEGLEARGAGRVALEDRDPSVRQAAVHSAGLHRDADALAALLKLVVADGAAPVRRESATALGRIRRGAAVPALFDAVRGGGDRFLEHALLYALIEIADREASVKGLQDPSPFVRRGALIALDQMEGGNLTRDQVTPLLNTSDPALQQTALAIMTRRPGWASETIDLLGDWLRQDNLDPARQESLRGALLAFSKEKPVQDLVGRALHAHTTPAGTRLLLLETMAQAPLPKLPDSWVKELGALLGRRDHRVVRQAIAVLRAARLADFDEGLRALARDEARPVDVRIAAVAALAPRLTTLEPTLYELLLGRLDREVPPLERLAAAQALAGAHLDDAQLEGLTRVLATAGGLELPHLLAPYEHTPTTAVGKGLVEALARSPGLTSLTPDALRRTLQGYPAEVRDAAGPLLKRLAPDAEQQKARLAELEPLLAGGDRGRGREVFFGKKATCGLCHAVRGEGGQIGPDLSTIGAIRSGRDVLESIVFPSTSFARGYEPYVVATRSGTVHTGTLARETAEAVYLHTADRSEIRVMRADIDTIEPGRVSIMPQGLDAQLGRQELSDLLAFLQSLK